MPLGWIRGERHWRKHIRPLSLERLPVTQKAAEFGSVAPGWCADSRRLGFPNVKVLPVGSAFYTNAPLRGGPHDSGPELCNRQAAYSLKRNLHGRSDGQGCKIIKNTGHQLVMSASSRTL